jgi:hypothetical protein
VHAWVYRLDDGLLRDLGFCATDPAGADVDFERNAGASTIVRVDEAERR